MILFYILENCFCNVGNFNAWPHYDRTNLKKSLRPEILNLEHENRAIKKKYNINV